MKKNANSNLQRKGLSTPALSDRQAKQVRLDETLLFRTLYEETPLVVLTIDRLGTVLTINKFGAAQLGYSPEELIGEPVSAIVYEEDRGIVEQQITECLQDPARVTQWELRKTRKDGTVLWMKEFVRSLRRAGGATMFLMTCEDITDLKKAMEMLRERERQQRAILSTIPDIAWLKDRENRFVAVNEAFGTTCGMRPEELAGKTDFDIWPEGVARKYRTDDEEVMASGRRRQFEELLTDRKGTKKWIEVIKTPVFNDEGEVIGMTGIARDITGRKQMEEALRASEELYRRLFETAKDGIVLLDPNTGRITHVNPHIADMLGHLREELVGKSLPEIGVLAAGEIGPTVLTELQSKGYLCYEDIVLRTKDGRRVIADIYLVSREKAFHCTIRNVTDRRLIEQALRERERQQRAILSTIPDIAWLKDRENRFVAVNEAFGTTCGMRPEELAGKTDFDIWPEGVARKYRTDDEEVMASGRRRQFEELLTDRKGTKKWIEVIKTPVFNDEGEVIGMTGIARDITGRKQMEEALEQSRALLEKTLSSLNEAVFIMDPAANTVAECNKTGEEMFGYSRAEMIGMPLHHLYGDKSAFEKVEHAARQAFRQTGYYETESAMKRKNGEILQTENFVRPLTGEGGSLGKVVWVIRDITEQKKMKEILHYQAYHDILTGLPNKTLFVEYLTLELAHAQRSGEKLAALFLDLDQFKSVNDTFGHSVGDALLVAVAERLRTCVRETDTVARIGGDAFTILLPHIALAEDAARIAQKVIEEFQQSFAVDELELFIAVSIGISIFPHDGEDAETLLKYADIALYHAKEQGRNHYQFYNPSINSRSLKRMRLENRLRQILDRKELVVHYQPQIDIATGKVVCVEALVRWQHPELGLLGPNQFISLAEEMGLIIPMGEWVLLTACAQNKAWQDAGYPPFCVSVNLSARQFLKPDLLEMIMHIVRKTGLSPEWLELEITEGTAMRDMDRTVGLLHRLQDRGIGISIDDFGTGYSSLSYLKKMPIQKLKIDKSFVAGLPEDPEDRAIVDAVIAMAHSMKLKVTAEGVETEEQLSFLRSRGCNEAQGYLLGKPLPAQESAHYISMGRTG